MESKKILEPINTNVVMKNANGVSTQYANAVAVNSNPVECVIEFGYVDLPEVNKQLKKSKTLASVDAEIKAKVVMPLDCAYSMANMILSQVKASKNK